MKDIKICSFNHNFLEFFSFDVYLCIYLTFLSSIKNRRHDYQTWGVRKNTRLEDHVASLLEGARLPVNSPRSFCGIPEEKSLNYNCCSISGCCGGHSVLSSQTPCRLPGFRHLTVTPTHPLPVGTVGQIFI